MTTPETKKCRHCALERPQNMYPVSNKSMCGTIFYRNTCQECRATMSRELRALHKINPLPPPGLCPICERYTVRFVLDHNHYSGEFRGFICNDCNSALGKLFDDPDMLRRAVRYLECD